MAALVTDSGRKTPARLAGRAILACQSDQRLVSLVRSGHERAFDAIVDRYRQPLLRYCRGILPESRAEDAVQQAFMNAHTSLIDADETVNLKPWLFAIARNASLNMLRQNGWNYEEIPPDFDGVRRPDQIFEQRAALQATVDALNDLPERQRSALVMREFEGRSYEEIAVALGANDGAVRQLLNRARTALRMAATAVIPPPLVARIAAAGPAPDGRRAAEMLSGLGAAGVAKAGATALVAGSLVVGAVEAPLPLAGRDQPTHQKATIAPDPAPARAHARAAKPSARSVAATTPVALHRRNHAASTAHKPAAVPAHSDGESVTHHSGSSQQSGDGQKGSDNRSGSGDDSHSGSGGSGSDGTRHTTEREGSSRSGGSDDSATSESRTVTSGGSDDAAAREPSSGSGEDSGSASDAPAPAPVDGSGSSEPVAPTGTIDEH